MKIRYKQNLKSFSRGLRSKSTIGEVLLWKEIKGRKLGYQFMRQKPILSYVIDFYCSPLKLAIEIDGRSHDEKIEDDMQRQQEIEELGITFLRFTERDVRANLDSVLQEIKARISEKQPPPRGLGTPFIKEKQPPPRGLGTPFIKGD